jgi:hypothetical protein
MSTSVCACEQVVHPRRISNPSGLTSIDYRVGDFTTFRHALLHARDGETALADWHPTTDGDLALQLLEWWAYLADVLVFYNERALHEGLLRTAVLPDDVRRVVRLLGYRPRPGIAATGVVAALADSPRPFVLERGFPIQAGSGGSKPPQIFEVDEDIEIGLLGRPLPASARLPRLAGRATTAPPNAWSGYAERVEGRLLNFVPAQASKLMEVLPARAGVAFPVAFHGLVTNTQALDTVLFLKRDWNGETSGYTLAVVNTLKPFWDPSGRPITVATLTPGRDLPNRNDYRVLKATKHAHLWLYHERYPGMKTPSPAGGFLQALAFVVTGGLLAGAPSTAAFEDPHVLASKGTQGVAHLEAITRGLNPGDLMLLEQTVVPTLLPLTLVDVVRLRGSFDLLLQNHGHTTLLTRVAGYSELIWYANPPESDRVGQGPPIGPPSHGLLSAGAAPIPIPHSEIRFHDSEDLAARMSGDDLLIRFVVVHFGWQEVGEVIDDATIGAVSGVSRQTTTPTVSPAPGVPTDAALPVLIEDSTGAGVPAALGNTNPEGPPLLSPLRALLNLLPVSRGQTVAREIIGSGDPMVKHQEFELQRWPLTYLTDTGPRSMNGYRSTLRIRVDDIEWHEVASFYEQPSDARVFVTREDDQQRTRVRFGDGELGARLPAGVDNVAATYRFGSGAEVPLIGSLTTILRPQQGLQAIRNPIAPGGGADPDPPDQIRRYAPDSVLTFGRAVSGDDYIAIAAQTPGVSRASARWSWDADAQRTLVKVFVGDDVAAVVAARTALRAFADPNRPIVVQVAVAVVADLRMTLEIDSDYQSDAVIAAVAASLLDPQTQPFGNDVVRIGEVVYDSQIYDVCLRVPGVVAVHDLSFSTGHLKRETAARHSPGEGRFYVLRGDRLHISTERVLSHGH